MAVLSWLAAVSLLGAPQGDGAKEIRDLIRGLASSEPSQRDSAFEKLKAMGERTRPELEKASRDPDSEVASRAGTLLRRLEIARELPPEIFTLMPTAVDRLDRGNPSEWVSLFLELAKAHSKTQEGARCLKGLAVQAFRAASSADQKKSLCMAVQQPLIRPAIPEIIKLLGDKDEEVRKIAAETLGKFQAHEREPELTALLGDPSPSARIGAARALLEIFYVDALPLVLPSLRDPSPEVRTEVINEIHKLQWEKYLPLGARVKELIPLLADPEDAVRGSAASILGGERCREALPHLIECLKDAESSVRRDAAKALGELGAKEAAARLEMTLKDPEGDVRQAAAEALGRLGARESVPALLRSMSGDEKEAGVRATAAGALGMLKAREALPGGRALLKDSDPELRQAAAKLLVDLEDGESAAALAHLLKDKDNPTREMAERIFHDKPNSKIGEAVIPLLEDPDADTRTRAVQVLTVMKFKKAYPALVRCLEDSDLGTLNAALWSVKDCPLREAVPELRKLLHHKNEEIREKAAETLLPLLGSRAAPDLVPLLDDPSLRVRFAAIETLGMLERAEDLPAFVRLLNDEQEPVRNRAVQAIYGQGRLGVAELRKLLKGAPERPTLLASDLLARLETSESADDVMRLLRSDDVKSQKQALSLLVWLEATPPMDEIVPLLKSVDSDVRRGALEALGSLGARNAFPAIRELLGDPECRVREMAIGVLAGLGDRECIPSMLKLLDDPAGEIRMEAIKGLSTLGAHEATGRLEALLQFDETRSSAIEALASLGAKGSARKILEQIGQGDLWWGQTEVAQALGTLEARDLIPDLRKLLKHRHAPIRSEAAYALGELGDQEAIPELMKLLQDPHETVVYGAADALGRLQAREAIPALRRKLSEPPNKAWDPGPSPAVVDALLRLKAREAIPELLAEVKRPHANTINQALLGLQQFRDRETFPQLLSYLTSETAYFEPEDVTVPPEERGRIPAVVHCTGLGGLVDTYATYSIPEIVADCDAREYIPDIEKLLSIGSRATRLAAAEALCRLGSTKGVPIILSEAENGNSDGLISLNALRQPALWARMREKYFPRTRSLTPRAIWGDIARTLGVRLEMAGRPGSVEWRSPFRSEVRSYEDRCLLLKVAKDQLRWTPFVMILEEDRIRVLRGSDALASWTEWWTARQPKK
jgi:HEAT repeat protein